MKKFCCILLVMLIVPGGEFLSGAVLVKNGSPGSVIVIEKNAPRQLKQAAEELQRFLFLISGAKIDVTTPEQLPPGMVRICIGENSITRNSGFSMKKFRGSGYDISVKNDLVILTGPCFRREKGKSVFSAPIHRQNFHQVLSVDNSGEQEEYSDFGPMHAVSAFLEHLGVRFYAPGKDGTSIPSRKNISVPDMRISGEAAFPIREYTAAPDRKISQELRRHLKFLKSGSALPPAGTFSIASVLRNGAKNHPSWLALQKDGKPYRALEPGGYPRYSDPSLRQKCWEELKRFISERPFLREILILPPAAVLDHIHAADEEKYANKQYPSTYLRDIPVEFYLFLAEKTAKHFPGRRLLYRSSRNLLPKTALLDRFPSALAGVPVNQGITAYAHPGLRKYHINSAKKFVNSTSAAKGRTREFWNEYDSTDIPRRGFYFSRMLKELRQNQRGFLNGFLIDLPISPETGSLAEAIQMNFILYVNSRLLWDPDIDVEALEQEYCRHFFGPAATVMAEFFREMEKSLCSIPHRGITPHFASKLQSDADKLLGILAKAAAQTLPGSIYRTRIDEILASHNWLKKDLFAKWKKSKNSLTGVVMPRDTPLDLDLSKYKIWYKLNSADSSMPRTEAAFTFSENRFNVFAAFRCYEPQMKKLTADAREHDDPAVKKEDHVTISVTSADGGEYSFSVNSAGVILDSCSSPDVLMQTGHAMNWSHRRNIAKVRRYADRWEVELSIVRCGSYPSPDLFPWKVQFSRSRFVSGKEQNSYLTGNKEKRCDFYFRPVDSKGRRINTRYNNVNIPIPGIPNGVRYSVAGRKTAEVGFAPADWNGRSWAHIKEGRLGNNLFSLGGSSHYVPDARFKLQYDDRALYVFYKVREKGVRALLRQDQQGVCLDSCMEIFLRPGGKNGKYYMNFEMNCIGTLLLAQVKIRPNNRRQFHMLPPEDMKKIKRYTSLKNADKEIKEEIVWYAGLEIPWEVVKKYTSYPAPRKGTVWTGNVYKCADWSRYPHWLAWKEIKTFHLPSDFGEFVFDK